MHSRVAAASFAAVLSPLAGVILSLAGALPARGGEVPFTERVISTTADQAFSVYATDLDGDGDIDVLSASIADNKIAWYESDGGTPPSFTERVISTTADGAISVFARDVDGDGNIDVLSASNADHKIAWYESDGGLPPTFTEHVISTNASFATSVFATDVDGDGDTDVLSASSADHKIAWYDSLGFGCDPPPCFAERVISTTADQASSVFAMDVDGDGNIDVLSASVGDDKIAWYESDGGMPPTFTERVISTTADGARSVFAADVDGDGDTDVLSASSADDKIAWYENDGSMPPSFTERVISTSADFARSVFATDLDGDGDIDVLSTSQFDGKIAWYESDGGLPPIFTERVIVAFAESPQSVFATDVDGDGDTDVLSASAGDDEIAWYENTTPPPPMTPLLRFNVVQMQIAGPPYPTLDSIRVDVLGEYPPDPFVPVEQFTLGFVDVYPPNPVTPVPMELIADDDSGGAGLFGATALFDFNWTSPPADNFPPDPIHFQLLVELLPSGGNRPELLSPPVSNTLSSTAFDVTFDVEVQPAAARNVAGADLDTAGHTLHFEIGAGQPIEFTNVVVGPINPLANNPSFPISFHLAKTGAEDPDRAMPLVMTTMTGTFEPTMQTIPTLSQWGLAVLTLLTLTAGTLVFSRRRIAANC